MATGDIVFIKGQNSSKRVAAGSDYISGLVFYTANLPSGFTTTNNIKQIFSTLDAVSLGINNSYSDETKAQGTFTVTTVGTAGETITISVVEPFGNTVVLGTYTQITGDNTTNKVGIGIAAAINANTQTSGYTAVNATSIVTVTARPGLGKSLNTTSMIATIVKVASSDSPVLAGTVAAFASGAGSMLALYYYHISEYFRGNPNSSLWVGFFPVPSTYNFAEVTTLQIAASGTIRQVGVFKGAVYSGGDLTALSNQIVTNCDATHKPMSALYAGDLSATSDITTIADLTLLSANKASSIIGQDGAATGALLALALGQSVTQLGIALGLLSLSSVSEDFGNIIPKYNLSDGTENNVAAFANGKLLSDVTIGQNGINAVDAKNHIFGMPYVGVSGTFFNDNYTAISRTSDYAYINDNRTIDKAIRGIYTNVLPVLKARLFRNADGTLTSGQIATIQSYVLAPLNQMQRDGDLSAVSQSDVYIDPTQNVVTTNTLVINVTLNEDGVARNIEIPISF